MQHKTIESVLERGEKLNDLVDRSNALSAQSKMFYKTAKKVRAPPPCAPRLPRSRQSRGRRSANRTAPPDGGAIAGARLGPGRPLGAANLKAQVVVLIAMPSPGRARGIRAGGQDAGSAELNFGLVVV